MTELRELQEEYIALEERKNEMESYLVANTSSKTENASLLPKLINTVASTSQVQQEKVTGNNQQKLVAMGSRDQEEYEKERNFYNRGGNNKIQRLDQPQETYEGQRQNYNRGQGGHKVVWEEIKMPPLNASVEKVWEAIILMENIPTPWNMGTKPPPNHREEILEGEEVHDNPLVVKLEINPKSKEDEDDEAEDSWAINRILIDTGSSVNILFYHTYKTMGGRDDDLIPSTYKIYGFNESPYNALIGRPWLHGILGVASTFHQCIKFPHLSGVGIIKGDWVEGKRCYETEVESCEGRANKKENWRHKIKETQRRERLMVDAIERKEEEMLRN
uniref:Uncharacterized protein with pepsin/retropepsin domain n=1 Tax=Papaver somniferum TaxID=3469 RepID=A0A5B7LJR3_PAPSO|nr:uncharacterized protein with pepsin/retropepsin domain [Papaver somniferum]